MHSSKQLISPPSTPCIRSRGTLASLDHAKWACLDAILSVADATNGPAAAAPGGGKAERPFAPLIRPELCRRLLAEALDVLQYCLEDETVVILRCLRRCWIQIMGVGPQEQVRVLCGSEVQIGPLEVRGV